MFLVRRVDLAPLVLAMLLAAVAPRAFAALPPECRDLPVSIGEVPTGLVEHCRPFVAAGGDPPPVVRAPTDLAFGAEGHNNLLVDLALDQPEVLTVVGPLASPNGFLIGGCEFDDGGVFDRLYCIEATDSAAFFSVSTATGAVTPIGTSAVLGQVFTALATDPTTGTMYAVTSAIFFSSLHTIDPATGAVTLIGGVSNAEGLVGAAFDGSGQLFAYDVSTDVLLKIDKTTAAGTVLGPSGFDANFNLGMDFDEDDGTCYLFAFNADSMQGELRTCDPVTGATALVGALGSTTPGGTIQVTAAAVATGGNAIFADGFESGDTSAWSATVP